MAEVKAINDKAYKKRTSAINRDKWLYQPINKNNDFPQLTDAQKKEVEDFWKPYEFAYINDYHQQEMYSGMSGVFDPSYFSFGLQRHLLAPFWNHESFKWIGDKNYSQLFFPCVKMPKTVFFKSFGYYFDSRRDPISKEQAAELLVNELEQSKKGEAILKPSQGGEGKDILFVDKNNDKEELLHIIEGYGDNLICQEVITNHSSFSAIYKKSLNTMRICTFIWKGTIYCSGAVLRMGTEARVDNWSQGGLACGINPNGCLQEYAFTELGKKVYSHPVTKVAFKDHKLYRAPEAIELAKSLHARIPQQKYVSWDITVDDEGDLVLIELNSPGTHELLSMAGFNGYYSKEIAKEILDEYLIKRFFFNKANFDWNYREFKDHISLREYKGLDDIVTIPEKLEDKPVLTVYNNAITRSDIKQINIPASVHCDKKAYPNVSSECIINRYDNQ